MSSQNKQRIAFLGLGLMGSGMANRILAAGFPMVIYNRTAEKAASLIKAGAELAGSPREAAANAEVVISMVADDAASRAMWLGDNGALAGAPRGALLIESSTLTPAWIRELAGAAKERGSELVDAPVTGSKSHAAAGELNFLAGGAAEAVARAMPVLAVMSRTITHVGPSGSGSLLKLINNFLCGVQAASWAEAMVLIEKAGLDRAKALELLLGGAPGSGLGKTITPRMAARDYTPNFLLKLMAKDLAYSLDEAKQRHARLAMVQSALNIFEQAIRRGDGEKDFSAVVELLRSS